MNTSRPAIRPRKRLLGAALSAVATLPKISGLKHQAFQKFAMARHLIGIPLLKDRLRRASPTIAFGCARAGAVSLAACSRDTLPLTPPQPSAGFNRPNAEGRSSAPAVGNAVAGRDVFCFETVGNEGFWSDAARLPVESFPCRTTVG